MARDTSLSVGPLSTAVSAGATLACHCSAARRAPDGARPETKHHRPEQTTLYRLGQQHAANSLPGPKPPPGRLGRRIIHTDGRLRLSINSGA